MNRPDTFQKDKHVSQVWPHPFSMASSRVEGSNSPIAFKEFFRISTINGAIFLLDKIRCPRPESNIDGVWFVLGRCARKPRLHALFFLEIRPHIKFSHVAMDPPESPNKNMVEYRGRLLWSAQMGWAKGNVESLAKGFGPVFSFTKPDFELNPKAFERIPPSQSALFVW